jgi:UDP-glucose 4-epimerase
MYMKVVVTGGAGFIGANLVARLVREPGISRIEVVDDLSTGNRDNLDDVPEATLHVGSILDESLLDGVLADADAIVHLAARPSVPRSLAEPLATHQANATGTLHVLEAARRAGRLHTVLASSSSVYGANPTLPKSEDLRPVPMSPYAVSKLATETYALAYQECFKLPVLVLRFFNVFGPLQPAGHAYAAAVPTFIDAAMRGEPIPLHGDGEQTRDFTYVGNVADVIVDALRRRVTSTNPVNLAFGSRRSLNEVIAELGRQLGVAPTTRALPSRPGDVRHSQADQTRFRSLFPDVEATDFTDGLVDTLAWFRSSDQAASRPA